MNQLERRSYVIDFSRRGTGIAFQVQGTGCVLGPVLVPENSASEQNSEGIGIYDDILYSVGKPGSGWTSRFACMVITDL